MPAHDHLGSPYASQLAACNDHYHAVCSINKFGPIAHTHALAQVFLERELVGDEWEALEMARLSLDHTRRLVAGEKLNKHAHTVLKARAKPQSAQVNVSAPVGAELA